VDPTLTSRDISPTLCHPLGLRELTPIQGRRRGVPADYSFDPHICEAHHGVFAGSVVPSFTTRGPAPRDSQAPLGSTGNPLLPSFNDEELVPLLTEAMKSGGLFGGVAPDPSVALLSSLVFMPPLLG